MMCLCYIVVALFLLLTSVPATSGNTVNITDGKVLKEYLCSSKRTISPNTHLILHGEQLSLDTADEVCLVENTTNITISGNSVYSYYVPVSCGIKNRNSGFAFFNVTNLTIRKVYFEGCGQNVIPAEAVKYINGTDQFFYYNGIAQTTFIFNHCHNLTLYNLLGGSGDSPNRFSMIGVNLCGWSNITAVHPKNAYPGISPTLISMLIYYTDTNITSPSSECNLHIQSNILSGFKYVDVVRNLSNNPERMPIVPIRDFAVFLSQQQFNVDVNIEVDPLFGDYEMGPDCIGYHCSTKGIIMFVNSVTDSHVTFKGYPYEFCINEAAVPYQLYHRSVLLDVMFYETPSFNISFTGKTVHVSPLLVQNTSFMLFDPGFEHSAKFYDSAILRVLQFCEKLSYEVVLDNVAWCNNTVLFPLSAEHTHDLKWLHLLHAQSLSFCDQTLYLAMNNIYVRHNTYYDLFRQLNYDSLVRFVNVNVTMTGTNYFGQNSGGSVIEVVSSNLTITNSCTISDGYANQGGGIKLDSASYLFLKEPLEAWFFNNIATQGSAIYAPIHGSTGGVRKTTSAIQILPNRVYSLQNLTDINVRLHFNNSGESSTGLESSLYAPDFSFFGRQLSMYFLFDADSWDSRNSCYVYTSLIDAIFNGTDRDKYSSLSNGICFGLVQKLNCTYIDQYVYSLINDELSPCDSKRPLALFPGQKALSLLCDNKEYQISDSNGMQQLSCETKNYTYWNTSVTRSNISLSFVFNYSSYCIALSNSAVSRSIPFLNVNFKENPMCPFGFDLTECGICDCIDALKNRSYKCDIDTQLFTSPPNYWTSYSSRYGYEDSLVAILLSTNCPPNYCNVNVSQNFHLNGLLSDLACLHDRTGPLCGQCRENFSVVFGSEACCSDCNNLYLLTLPAYALAGLLLVVLLFALRLTVATGTINGVIFYANILELSMDLLTPQDTKLHLSPLHIIISLLNLNLGFPMCFYNGMTLAGK